MQEGWHPDKPCIIREKCSSYFLPIVQWWDSDLYKTLSRWQAVVPYTLRLRWVLFPSSKHLESHFFAFCTIAGYHTLSWGLVSKCEMARHAQGLLSFQSQLNLRNLLYMRLISFLLKFRWAAVQRACSTYNSFFKGSSYVYIEIWFDWNCCKSKFAFYWLWAF